MRILLIFLLLVASSKARARSFYDVLSVDPQSSDQAIHEQYKKLVRLHHPDRFSDPSAKRRQTAVMTELNTAKDILLRDDLRYYYDLISRRGLRHDVWMAQPRNTDLETLAKVYGPVKPRRFADQMTDPEWRRRFVTRNLAAEAPAIRDADVQRAILKAIKAGDSDGLAELIATKFIITDRDVATELLEIKKTVIGIDITEQALKHRSTNHLFHITQNEAIEYLYARSNDRDLEVSRRARQAINTLGLPPDPLYPIKDYLHRVQRCYGAH